MTYLLDANVLIALIIEEHEHHERSANWASTVDGFAICPIVEGALVRFLIRMGESAMAAMEVIHRIHDIPSCDFWPDSLSYIDVDLRHVVGHRQVTDAYLVGIAHAHNATLATLDDGLASSLPNHTLLVPPFEPQRSGLLGRLGGSDPQASAAPRHRPRV